MSERWLPAAFVVAIAAAASAQPACPECTRGDALIDRFSLQPLRAIAGELAAAPLGDPVTAGQYAHLVELRARTPAAAKLGALDDGELGAVAASLCRSSGDACAAATTRTLRCLADRCAVDLPERRDPVEPPDDDCRRSSRQRSRPYGLGIDWATGWQHSRYPNDGRAWSLGIEGRMRIDRRFGAVARVDRIYGQGNATDIDGDHRADFTTPAIARISVLAGPSVVFDVARFENTLRFLRLDLLGGYVATTSQPNENGPAAGFDLAYQLTGFRFGVRFVQGFGEAQSATMLLAHLGVLASSPPIDGNDSRCRVGTSRGSSLALAFDFPLGGYGFWSELGYLAPGLAIAALWHLFDTVDLMARADLLIFPGFDHQRVLHQAALAGVRLALEHDRQSHTTLFTTMAAGYSLGTTLVPTKVGSGPIADLSLAWGYERREAAIYLALHARGGLTAENTDYVAVFVSLGVEMRFDPRRWHRN